MCVARRAALASCAGDCDGDGRDEACRLFADCNETGLPDSCDIANGTSTDNDGNCIPDECDAEPAPLAEPAGVPKTTCVTESRPESA